MNVYMSFWTGPIQQKITDSSINIWKLSLALAKKHYGYVELITDKKGYLSLKDLPFDNFRIVLDDVPDYPTVWSLGKIYAYKYICKISKHFLHLDNDVFLWTALPEDLVDQPVFCQSESGSIGNHHYDFGEIIDSIKLDYPKIYLDYTGLRTYNMGVVGGTNMDIIQKYCDFVMDLIQDSRYAWLWNLKQFDFKNNPQFILSNRKAILIEQAAFAIVCKKHNIIPSLLFKSYDDPKLKEITHKKYSHLMFMKKNKDILNKISKRVQNEPYNLDPNDSQQ